MCFYARRDFKCKDWRWGNMMERCPRQHRIGETCGAKLVHTEYLEQVDEKCKVCQDIDVKYRKLKKTQENIARWSSQKGTFAALLEKAENEKGELEHKIQLLMAQRESVKVSGRQVRSMGISDSSIPPIVTAPSAYSWSSQPPKAYGSSSGMASGYDTSLPIRSGNGRGALTASRQTSVPYAATADRYARHAR